VKKSRKIAEALPSEASGWIPSIFLDFEGPRTPLLFPERDRYRMAGAGRSDWPGARKRIEPVPTAKQADSPRQATVCREARIEIMAIRQFMYRIKTIPSHLLVSADWFVLSE